MYEKELESLGRLLCVMDELREKCPWDREQTFESLRNNTIEETFELTDANRLTLMGSVRIRHDLPELPSGTFTATEWDGTSGSEDIPFRLSSVHVFRVNNSYGLIPDATVLAAGNPTLPTGTAKHDYDTPQKVDMFSFTVSNSLYTTQDIYVPENDVKMGGTLRDANHTNRMAIVVGGSYDANGDGDFDEAVSYYRLDFAKNGALMNVLRNHLYQFNIPSVSGKGYDDPVVAYEATGISMEYNVFDWNANDIGSGFNGPYSFSVSPNELTFVAAPTGGQTINVTTDHPDGWTAEVWDNANGTGTGARSWLTVPASGTGTIMNISASTNTASIRTAWIHITSGGRITLKVKVTQERAERLKVYAPPGVVGIKKSDYEKLLSGELEVGDNNQYSLTLRGSSTYAADYIASYTGNRDYDYIEGIADQFGGLESEPVYIVYFKWGSMVAMIGGDGDTWSANDVVWVNDDFNGTIDDRTNYDNGQRESYPFISYGGFSAANYITTISDYDIVDNPVNGEGDICKELTGGTYRIPFGHMWHGTTESDWSRVTAVNIGVNGTQL